MTPAPFTVPFGADPAGRIVPIETVDPGVSYTCPACASPLVLKAGQVVRHHFAHKAATDCSRETALHEATKRRIRDAVLAWRQGSGPAPVVVRRCDQCREAIKRSLSERCTDAVLEHRVPPGRVLDVALLDAAGAVVLGIEVFVTHEVDAGKEASLGDLPWIEVAAAGMEQPWQWAPRRAGGRLRENVCPECLERPRRRRRLTEEVCSRYGLAMPANGFVAVEPECWKCHRATPMFYWPGIGVRREAPRPWPRTVRVRYSNTTQDRYLANSCIQCDSVQGEHFLQEGLRSALGDAPDLNELDELFFSPLTEEEADRAPGALSLEEMINIVVPMPARRS